MIGDVLGRIRGALSERQEPATDTPRVLHVPYIIVRLGTTAVPPNHGVPFDSAALTGFGAL